ncbi:MAG: CoA transferase [Pseudomonadales bacterium]|nr:CoA transferase [Pseudomonadales bacterium]
MTNQHVMEGFRVLDFTQVVAGPTTTRLMAEMGAEIIKVELMPIGDMTRTLPFQETGNSSYFIQQNRGKKSICINPKTEKGMKILRDLVAKVDVLIENFAAGVIGRMGLGYEQVKAINPNIIMCSISGFGQTGPLSNKPGYDLIAASYAGVLDNIGYPDGYPVFPQLALGDATTGIHALAAINAALLYRERTGEGQFVDISLLDSYYHQHEMAVQSYSVTKGAFVPKRTGHHHFILHPLGIYKGRGDEEYYSIIIPPTGWADFCAFLGKPEYGEDPRFDTNEARMENHQPIVDLIEDWLCAQPSREVILEKFEEARYAIGPVLTVPETMEHPHFIERRVVRTVADRSFGEIEIPGMPLRFSKFSEELTLETPFLGEHNNEILGELLSMDADEIEALTSEGVLHSDVPDIENA